MLKQLYWKLREIISQVFVLLIIGFALIWIGKNLSKLEILLYAKWIKIIFYFCVFLYIILFQSIIRSLIGSTVMHSYNATDSESLKRLKNKKKYQLTNSLKPYAADKHKFFQMLNKQMENQNFKLVTKNNLGLIFEKKTPFLTINFKQKEHRVFLLYRSLFNVLIVDNILNEAKNFIHYYRLAKPVSQNKLIIISDMENEEEILSAGTGIVNFMSSKRSGYLYPIFIDLCHGHIFYPQDISLMPWYKRIARMIEIYRFKNFLNHIGSGK